MKLTEYEKDVVVDALGVLADECDRWRQESRKRVESRGDAKGAEGVEQQRLARRALVARSLANDLRIGVR